MSKISKHLIISGRVQGVGFRYFTYRNAKELRLKGWVKNLRDGTVETVFTGDAENVYKMIEQMKEGPASARVENIEDVEVNADTDSFNDFTIKR